MVKTKVRRRRKPVAKSVSKADIEENRQLMALLFSKLSPEQIAKASIAAAAVASGTRTTSEAVKLPKNTTAWLQLYTKHVWAYAGMYAIANSIAGMPRKLLKRNRKTGDIEEVDTHPSLDLMLTPNDSMTGYDLMEGSVVYLESVGMSYWEVVYENKEMEIDGIPFKKAKVPVELHPIRPDRLEPVPRKDGKGIKEYKFKLKKHPTSNEVFQPEQIVPLKYFNPTNDWLGLGSIQPAIDDVRLDKQMAAWNLDFFVHGMTMEGILSVKGTLNKKQMDDIAEQMKEFLRGKGRKIPVFSTEGGIEFQPLSVDPKDIDFITGRKENRQAILAALGVPPVMVGLLEHAKYDNYALQLEAYAKHTVTPKIRKIESGLAVYYLPMFPDIAEDKENDWYISFDTSGLTQEDKDKLTKRLVLQFEHGWLTPNEARGELGFEPYNETEGQIGGNKFYMKNNLVPVGQETDTDLELREDEVVKQVIAIGADTVQAIDEIREEVDAMKSERE